MGSLGNNELISVNEISSCCHAIEIDIHYIAHHLHVLFYTGSNYMIGLNAKYWRVVSVFCMFTCHDLSKYGTNDVKLAMAVFDVNKIT